MPDTLYDAQHRAWDLAPDGRYRRRHGGILTLTLAELEARHGITGQFWHGQPGSTA